MYMHYFYSYMHYLYTAPPYFTLPRTFPCTKNFFVVVILSDSRNLNLKEKTCLHRSGKAKPLRDGGHHGTKWTIGSD